MINWEICEKCPHEDECKTFNPEDCVRYRAIVHALLKYDEYLKKFAGYTDD